MRLSILIFLSHFKVFGRYGAGWHRGNVRATQLAATGLNLGSLSVDGADNWYWPHLVPWQATVSGRARSKLGLCTRTMEHSLLKFWNFVPYWKICNLSSFCGKAAAGFFLRFWRKFGGKKYSVVLLICLLRIHQKLEVKPQSRSRRCTATTTTRTTTTAIRKRWKKVFSARNNIWSFSFSSGFLCN